ncbi:DUF2778 domain-containing protein [Xanthobacter sp. AM11]|uniref:DUF2778 domain-containing protein n=1 Tax=Xanthobacter sp. AM11 TaxID=3380643 RepID=UPI0039BED8C2
MSHTNWTPQEDENFFDPLGPEGRPRGTLRHGTLIGVGAGIAFGLMVTLGAVWATQGSFSFNVPEPATVPQAQVLAAVGMSVTEITFLTPSGALEIEETRLYATSLGLDGRAFTGAAAPADAPRAPTVQVTRSVPLPAANPLFAGRAPGDAQSLQGTDPGTAAPLPQRNPLVRDQRLAYASLPDPAAPLGDTPAPPAPADTPLGEDDVALPTPQSDYAVYDIKGRKLYMPGGDRFEAHSGYGEMMDDVRHVSRRMVGPTPPNTYSLTMRESRFHGVEAVRMNPVGTGKMYGRAGILVHPYMLGPRGDSNGCVSVKEYEKFLAAFKRGEVKRIVVVAELKKPPADANSLFSWLKPKTD